MHSCREMMGVNSVQELRKLCSTFFSRFSVIDKNMTVDL